MKRILIIATIITSYFSVSAQISADRVINAFSKSYDYEKLKNYSYAIGELKNVYDQNSFEMNLRLGWLSYLNGDYVTSQTYYKKSISLRPTSIDALLGYVMPVSALESWDDVLSTYQKVLKLDPNHSSTNYSIALMYYYRRDYAKAEQHDQIVLDHYPFDYDAMLLMAGIKMALGKKDQAKEYYSKVLIYNPTDEIAKQALEKL